MAKKLVIKLLPNGEVQMETKGVKGKKCLEYVPFLEQLADVKVQSQEFTREYYEEENYVDDEQQLFNRYD